MRKFLVIMIAVVALMACSAMAQDLGCKGKMMGSAYASYAFGMGDAFKGVTTKHIEISQDAGIGFGGMFHYGVTEQIFVGGELGVQSYKAKSKYTGPANPAASALNFDDSSMKINFLANCLYAINYTDDADAFFVTAGAGLYGGFDDIGLNGGIVYRKMVSPSVGVFFMPRFHFLFSDPSAMMVQIAAGVSLPLGN